MRKSTFFQNSHSTARSRKTTVRVIEQLTVTIKGLNYLKFLIMINQSKYFTFGGVKPMNVLCWNKETCDWAFLLNDVFVRCSLLSVKSQAGSPSHSADSESPSVRWELIMRGFLKFQFCCHFTSHCGFPAWFMLHRALVSVTGSSQLAASACVRYISLEASKQ